MHDCAMCFILGGLNLDIAVMYNCIPGYYGVGGWSDDGCIQCLCSGHSNNCTTGQGWYTSIISSSWSVRDNTAIDDRWLGVDSEGNDVTVDDEYVNLE